MRRDKNINILFFAFIFLVSVTVAAAIAFQETPILSEEEAAEIVFVHVNTGFPAPNSVPQERDVDEHQESEILSILRKGTEKRTLQRAESISLPDVEYRIFVYLRSSDQTKEICLGNINRSYLDYGHAYYEIQNAEELASQLKDVISPR